MDLGEKIGHEQRAPRLVAAHRATLERREYRVDIVARDGLLRGRLRVRVRGEGEGSHRIVARGGLLRVRVGVGVGLGLASSRAMACLGFGLGFG
eukprot:scaffold38957_cov42-Phaeocystis_antarctica.AAC.1